MSDWSSRRRVNLSELQRDLAQVAPVEADDFEALADTVTSLLKKSKDSALTKALNKQAIWDRVMSEMDNPETADNCDGIIDSLGLTDPNT